MLCPYCNNELEAGVIQSQHELYWREKRHFFFISSENDISLSERNIWKGSAVKALLCRNCQKIIIDYSGDGCDLNKLKAHND